MLHDIGKLDIDRRILSKAGPLSTGEQALMRQHPESGASMLRAEGERTVIDIALRHHERLDGSGYPDFVGAESISEAVQIVTLCDVFAAMTERRPYGEALDWHTALP